LFTLLLVENPGYIFVRESAAIIEETYKLFHQRRRYPRSIEEDTAPPRRNHTLLLGGMGHTKLVYEVHQISRTHGGAAHPTSPLDTIIRSTSIRSAIFRGVCHHDGGGGE
jgi:hypothetical protein